MPEDMPEDMSEYMPEDMSDRMPEDMSEYMPEDMPDRMPEDMSDRVPEDMPDRMPEDLPDRMPEDMPEDMPDHMPEDMPDRMSNRMSEDMSDRMPEDLPVRKCINVMVGITRSKVICCEYDSCAALYVFLDPPFLLRSVVGRCQQPAVSDKLATLDDCNSFRLVVLGKLIRRFPKVGVPQIMQVMKNQLFLY